jgi:hypothetical protein
MAIQAQSIYLDNLIVVSGREVITSTERAWGNGDWLGGLQLVSAPRAELEQLSLVSVSVHL